MVSDYMKTGLIKLALLSERQIERLMNWRYNLGLPPLLTGKTPGLHSGMAGCQLLATSLAAEARLLASPASVQTIPTNANNQDVVSMGTISAKMTKRVLPIAWKILAIEALAIVQAADLKGDPKIMGEDYKKFYDLIRGVSEKLNEDRPLYEDIERATALLQTDEAAETCLKERPANPLNIDM